MSRSFRMPAAVLGLGIVLVSFAGPAEAHVTVHSTDAAKGGYALLDFRVPNETDNTNTTKVAVTFSTPIQSASPEPVDGWTATIVKGKLAKPVTDDDGNVTTDGVAGITWTATGKGLPPTYFQSFDVSAGPLPDQATLTFPTLQTYSDGQVVRWIDPVIAGQAEPDHPAPTLSLTGAATATTASDKASVTTVVKKEQSKGLGIAALVVGGVGVLLAGYSLSRRPGA